MTPWIIPLLMATLTLGIWWGSWATREELALLRKERERYRRWLDDARRQRDTLWERVVELQDEERRR